LVLIPVSQSGNANSSGIPLLRRPRISSACRADSAQTFVLKQIILNMSWSRADEDRTQEDDVKGSLSSSFAGPEEKDRRLLAHGAADGGSAHRCCNDRTGIPIRSSRGDFPSEAAVCPVTLVKQAIQGTNATSNWPR
jgi:hypothetical protein